MQTTNKNMDIEDYVNLKEKTLAIGHQFTKFINVFSCQCFPLYSNCSEAVEEFRAVENSTVKLSYQGFAVILPLNVQEFSV